MPLEGQHPFWRPGDSFVQLFDRLCVTAPPRLADSFSPAAQEFVRALLAAEEERLDLPAVRAHPSHRLGAGGGGGAPS